MSTEAHPATTAHSPQSREPAPSAAEPAWLAHGHVPCLDGLRAISILLVLIAHGARTHGSPIPSAFFQMTNWGSAGVDMFFVISGFLITLLLLREYQRTRTVSLRDFYIRRGFRILPAYGAFLLGLLVLSRVDVVALRPTDWAGALTYTVNFRLHPSWCVGHIWSLSVEEHFYLLWPLVFLLAGPKRAFLLAACYAVLTPLLRLVIWRYSADYLDIEYCTPTRMDSIAVGCCLAFLAASPRIRGAMTLAGWRADLIAILLVIAVVVSRVVLARCDLYRILLSHSADALCMGGMIWICVNRGESVITRVLNARPFVVLGLLSYSIYIWQQPFLNSRSDHWMARWPVNVCLAGIMAVSSYLLIEKPFLRLKERLRHVRVE